MQRQKSHSYRLVGPVDADEEERLGDKEADAQVLVDGVSVALQPAEEAKGEDADKQAHQRQQDPHPCDDIQQQVVHAVCFLWTEREREREALEENSGHLWLLYIKGYVSFF